MKRTSAVLALPLSLLARADAQPGTDPVTLDNGYFRVQATGHRLTSLRVDASGEGRYGANWLVAMGYEGFTETPDTVAVPGHHELRVRGLSAELDERIQIENGGVADQLAPGRTLGQSFQVHRGYVTRLEVLVPTWRTADSAATLSLRRDHPEGELVAQRRLENVRDNSWQELAFERQGDGQYYVELSEPKGEIGWWSARARKYQHGQAYQDGHPVADAERSLRVRGRRPVGEAEVAVSLHGPRLKVAARVRPLPGEEGRAWPLAMRVRWDNEGYDVSARSVPFFRFFTDNMRYMPVQQLKRWKERDGWYELSFSGCRWVEADGVGDYDLRFHGRGLALAWHLAGKETTVRLSPGPTTEGTALVNEVTVEALPRHDALPSDWPEFVLPGSTDTQEANALFYERAFTYPPVWGPAAWFEWNALVRVWQGGDHLDELRRHLEHYPMTDEGYVHTWGAGRGWPFPNNEEYDTRHFDTNARFILACWRYAAWTGDVEFLRRQAERLRQAMAYQLTALRGREGLIVAASSDVNGRHMGVGNNYWDILPFGHLDAYANVLWYASLEAMAQIEEMLAAAGGADAEPPSRSPKFYRRLARKARRAYNQTFWDDAAGRYIGCIDIDGRKHDYGFTFVNLEAMAYGLASQAKARRIYQWMETEPTSTGKADTYGAWVFAPRANTLHNPRWHPKQGKLDDVPQEPWWHFGWRGTAYGDQCQDGGAILYTSFYDLMARCTYLGPDNAWERWQEILARWRMPDHLCGGPPLYRGEHPQQILPGAVGVDIPFPESGLVPCWLLYGLLGVEATSKGLQVAPRLPKTVPRLEVRNVAYGGLPLNIRGSATEVVVSCQAPGYEFTWRREVGDSGGVVFKATGAPVRFPPRPVWEQGRKWRAEWIWLRDGEAPTAFFRHTFDLPAQPKHAWLSITADNAFVLYVNGEQVASGANWALLYSVDLARHLRKGVNVLAIAADNAGGPGGVVAEGQVLCPDGTKAYVFTSRRWRVSPVAGEGWLRRDFDDRAWKPAREYGRPPCPPWLDIGDPLAPLSPALPAGTSD